MRLGFVPGRKTGLSNDEATAEANYQRRLLVCNYNHADRSVSTGTSRLFPQTIPKGINSVRLMFPHCSQEKRRHVAIPAAFRFAPPAQEIVGPAMFREGLIVYHDLENTEYRRGNLHSLLQEAPSRMTGLVVAWNHGWQTPGERRAADHSDPSLPGGSILDATTSVRTRFEKNAKLGCVAIFPIHC